MKQDELLEAIRTIRKEQKSIANSKVLLADYCRDIANKMEICYTSIDDLKTELEQLLLDEVINGN